MYHRQALTLSLHDPKAMNDKCTVPPYGKTESFNGLPASPSYPLRVCRLQSAPLACVQLHELDDVSVSLWCHRDVRLCLVFPSRACVRACVRAFVLENTGTKHPRRRLGMESFT